MRIKAFSVVMLTGVSALAWPALAQAQDAATATSPADTAAPVTLPQTAAPPATVSDAPPSSGSDIVVLGSRIPRVQQEGPAPVTTYTAKDIQQQGFTSVPDLLKALPQNNGYTDSQQDYSGASFVPGAEEVNLLGLGVNHTLVLVNGRRVADFPLPYNGQSNFTDISNIPIGLIDRVEILSGSDSAIYGSDAIAGVVNFQLKQKADGTRIDFRDGFNQKGGDSSQKLTVTTGWDTGRFHGILGVQLLDQHPLWMYDRKIQDSTADQPGADHPLARRNFLRTDEYGDYIDPGEARCDALSNTNMGTTYYAARDRYAADGGPGYFCGSNEAVAYGTIISGRKAADLYGSLRYTLGSHAEAFLDLQAGYSDLKLFRDVLDWQFQDANGSEDGIFYNANTGALDSWYRLFTPEEMGGLKNGYTTNRSFNFTLTPGLKGSFGSDDKWNYELSWDHSEYHSRVVFPQTIASKANDLFLGPQMGVDADSGYPIFAPDIDRLYTALTPEEYASITAGSTYHPRSRTDNVEATVNTTSLFKLPAGPVGLALSAEIGNQGYNLDPDPLALTHYYYALTDSDGQGTRAHYGLGYEVRVPVLKILQVSTAGRYDHYDYAGHKFGKFTYNAGVEFRPAKSLLIRGAYGTGFRAPDLHYVYSGPGNTHPSGNDYYRCRTLEPGVDIDDCDYAGNIIVSSRVGNPELLPETSKSLNAGFVFSPGHVFDMSVDYYRVTIANEVLDMDGDTVLRDEADCRIGHTDAGTPVDPTSPTCVDALARVVRQQSGPLAGTLLGVIINPINAARERTAGIEAAAHLHFGTGFGKFVLSASYDYVFKHDFQQYKGDTFINEFAVDSDYDIPRDKGTASISWNLNKLTATIEGSMIGHLPNYDEDAYIKRSFLFNASTQYDFTNHLEASLVVDNLFDQNPIKDNTYTGYPYYDYSWFNSIGRSFFVQFTYKLGGAKL